MRIVVTGKNGQLASALAALTDTNEKLFLNRPDIDLSRPESLREPIMASQPDIIISAAAYTQVDKAEEEPDLAAAVNTQAPAELARIASALGVPIIHLSTDYVFDGKQNAAYREGDEALPLTVYGRTKRAGEIAIAAETDNFVIARTSWVFSPYGRNFVKTMLQIGQKQDQINVVEDQKGCPTSACDLAGALIKMSEALMKRSEDDFRGTFHVAGSEETNWAQFAQAIFTEASMRGAAGTRVNPIISAEYPAPVVRPINSRLNTDKLSSVYGIKLSSWRQSLGGVLDSLRVTSPELFQ